MDLFGQNEFEKKFEVFSVLDGEILFMRNFLSTEEAQKIYEVLQNTINWKQEQITIFGKTHPIPRKTAWYGDEGFNYSYSGINCYPDKWTKELLEIKSKIEKLIPPSNFTSVLLNLYNDGNDKMGWHADNEK